MRYTNRPKLEETVCVHLVSRVVQRRRLMDERGMEEMRRLLDTQAAFAGLQVITFCFLQNHFHLLVRVDPETAREQVSDEELIRRFRSLYGTKRSPSLGLDAEGLEIVLKRDDKRAAEARARLLARMGDVSVFMREFKTRFTLWYNETYQSVGTFWAERFRSVLVEPGSLALLAVAAYIDLNAVRAGLAEHPRDYRFCGLAEAESGNRRARAAYRWLAGRAVRAQGPRDAPDSSEATIYAAYVAQVGRMCRQIAAERAALAAASSDGAKGVASGSEAPAGGPFSGVASLLSNGRALGSRAWVEKLCRKGGVFGFLRDRQPKPITVEGVGDVHAARPWVR
ncbi:MAG: transposase [Opitutales bacterium]|nr:transposase [Opitutales bacterium]